MVGMIASSLDVEGDCDISEAFDWADRLGHPRRPEQHDGRLDEKRRYHHNTSFDRL